MGNMTRGSFFGSLLAMVLAPLGLRRRESRSFPVHGNKIAPIRRYQRIKLDNLVENRASSFTTAELRKLKRWMFVDMGGS